jgi:hypothetical protein
MFLSKLFQATSSVEMEPGSKSWYRRLGIHKCKLNWSSLIGGLCFHFLPSTTKATDPLLADSCLSLPAEIDSVRSFATDRKRS